MNKPIAWMQVHHKDNRPTKFSLVKVWEDDIPLYTHPAELTDEEIDQAIKDCGYDIEKTVMGKFVDIEGINMYNSLCGFAKELLKKAQKK